MTKKIPTLPTDEHVTPAEYIGRDGIWTFSLRGGEPISFQVKIVDARNLWKRIDLLVESNVGDRFWVSNKTVKLIREEVPEST